MQHNSTNWRAVLATFTVTPDQIRAQMWAKWSLKDQNLNGMYEDRGIST